MRSRAASVAGDPRCQRYLKGDRLRKRFEFRNARLRGRRVHTRSFVVLIAAAKSPRARLGLTVSRRAGNAVRRNRLKRLVREVFRQHRELFPARADVVVIARSENEAASFAEVCREFERAAPAMKMAAQAAARGGTA